MPGEPVTAPRLPWNSCAETPAESASSSPLTGPARGWRAFVPFLLPFVILVVTGVRGLDFGFHWDERIYQIGPVKHMV